MSTARAPARVSVTIVVGDAAWLRRLPRARALVRRAVNAALAGARRGHACALTVALTSDRALRALNRDFRGRDKPTNVLSFPSGAPPYLGDIAIARATVAGEARAQGKRLDHHLIHLVVHGTLHLLGYDHRTRAQASRLEALERRVLGKLSIGDPYLLPARGAPGAAPKKAVAATRAPSRRPRRRRP